MIRIHYVASFLFFLLVLSGCSVKPVLPEAVEPAAFASARELAVYDNVALSKLKTSNDSLTYQPADYQVTIYRITYRTTLRNGASVMASGVLYVPAQLRITGRTYPVLEYQHPTAFTEAEAPSGGDYTHASFSYQIYFATHGYIVACPDYIGYGEARQIAHPYENRQMLAQATVDMLRATKEFLESKKLAWNGQVFMAGYSEGGYATLSAQKLIQEQYAPRLTPTATACGAGPYAMTAFFDYITHNTTPSVGVVNYLYVWQTLDYNTFYGIDKPVEYYFKAPYAQQISQSLENVRSFNVSFDQLCTEQFKADVRNSASAFGQALADNNLDNWRPFTPTYLIHGSKDEVIPYFVSAQTYSVLRTAGATQVGLVTLPNLSHIPGEVIFMRRTLELFERFTK